jgi:hypothetical protein
MADDCTKCGPQDRSRENISEAYERRYWSEKWGVSPEQVKAAVAKVSNSVDAVARRLGKQPAKAA